jgi:hypothetical protein
MRGSQLVQWVKDGVPQDAFVGVAPDGNISRVVNNAKDEVKSLDLIKAAIARGGDKVDAWDIGRKLPGIYEKFGFKIDHTVPYDVENYGEPSDALKDHWRRFGWKDGESYPAITYMKLPEAAEYAGEERRTARRPPMNATELESAMKNRKPIETPFDVTQGAQDTINRDPSMPQRNPQAVTPTYTDKGNGLHEVSTGDDQNTSVGKGILLAQDVDGNPDAVRVAAHWVAPDARGQGVGTSQLETLAKSLTDKTTLLSDKDMTDAAKGAWDKFQAAHPDAITKTPSGGYIADLDKLREGSQNSQLKAAVNPTRDTDAFAAARAKLGPDATLSEVAQEAARAVKSPEPSLLDQALTPNKDESEIATRRPTSTKTAKNNAPGQYADMAGVEAASKATPGGNGKLGYAEKMARTIAKYSGIDYT